MARQKKDGKFFTGYIKKELMDMLDEHSKATMLPKTTIIELALSEYLKKNAKGRGKK